MCYTVGNRQLGQLLLYTALQEEVFEHATWQEDQDSRLSSNGLWPLYSGRFSAHQRSRRFLH